MKLIRLLPILLVIGLSCLTSCQKEEIPSADNERTLFMYLPWSTNLTSYFYQNIEDMEDAISRRGLDKERVIVFLSTSSTEAEEERPEPFGIFPKITISNPVSTA